MKSVSPISTILKMLLVLIIIISLNSCKTPINGCTDPNATNYNSNATENDGSCVYGGQIIFWDAISLGYTGTVDSVFVNSQFVGTITNSYNSPPACGATGCVTYSGAPATYNWSDKLYVNYHLSSSRNGVVSIPGIGCTPVKVH
jgi:hypothetical protein